MTKSSEYKIWGHIKERCFKPSSAAYRHYGGRGITMYEPWINDFMAFYNYVGKRPSPEHTIDRINVDGNYEPGNIKWSTRKEQANNKRPRTWVSNKTGYIGVYKQGDEWRAGLNVSLGVFDTPEKAALAYNKAITKLRGKGAVINTIVDSTTVN